METKLELRNLNEVLRHFYKFYSKSLDEFSLNLWNAILKPFDLILIKYAFLDYTKSKSGKYLPRPSQILEICQEKYDKNSSLKVFQRRKPNFISIYQEDHNALIAKCASFDKEISKQAWKDLQKVRSKMATEYLIFINGGQYHFKDSLITSSTNLVLNSNK